MENYWKEKAEQRENKIKNIEAGILELTERLDTPEGRALYKRENFIICYECGKLVFESEALTAEYEINQGAGETVSLSACPICHAELEGGWY